MTEVVQILDQAARDKAQDPTRSCIVQAPAGSGKTTLLAERYLRLLTTVRQPEAILAITFTRKAAAEMRERVLKELADSSSEIGNAATTHATAEGWQLDKYPSRLRIQTIDSFATNLVKQLPITSPLQQTNICAHPEDCYHQAVARVLRRITQDQPDDSAVIAGELLGNFFGNNVQVHNLLVTMLRRREQWQFMLMERLSSANGNELIEAISEGIEALQEQALRDLDQTLTLPLRQKLQSLAAYACDNLPDQRTFDALDAFEQWRFVADNLLLTATSSIGKPQLRKKVDKRQGFPKGTPNPKKDELHALLADMAENADTHRQLISSFATLRMLPGLDAGELDQNRLALVGAVLFNCVTELNELFNERGEVDFNQITIAAITALGTPDAPSDLALSLDYRINHLLIDEFQDTSRAQHELFSRLIREWTPDDGNTFFAVGDPMQSIYRFRNAEVSLFLEVCEQGMADLPLEHLRLTTNFRSSDPMIGWFNQVFSSLLGDTDDPTLGAISYAGATSPRKSLEPLDQDQLLGPLKLSASISEQNDQVVAHIKQLAEETNHSNIAILLRNRAPVGPLVKALEAANIPWQGTDLHALGNTAIVSDAVNLARTLVDPGDRVSTFALLRSPLVGLSLVDLSGIARALEHAAVNTNESATSEAQAHAFALGGLSPLFYLRSDQMASRLSNDAVARVQRLQSIAAPILQRRLTLAPRELIETLWLHLGGPKAYPEGTHKHVMRLFDVIEAGHPRQLEPWQLERDIEKLYAEDDSSGVQILTVHKSKGLQYEHVLVPNLQSRDRPDESQLLMSREASTGYLMACRMPGDHKADEKARSLYHWLREEEKQRAKNEVKRLLYVAATRAERSLVLFGTLFDNKSPWSNSLLGALAPVFGELWQDLPAAEDKDDEPKEEPVDLKIDALPATLAAPVLDPPEVSLPSRARRTALRRVGPELDDPELLFANERRAAILRGNLTHQMLCNLTRAISESAATEATSMKAVSALIERERPLWRQQAMANGLGTTLAEEVANTTADGITRVVNSELGRWCALDQQADSQAELPLTLWENSGPIKLVIDRTFVTSKREESAERDRRTRWIIDYKTAQPGDDLDDEKLTHWLQAELERYRPQLAGYARALQAMHPHQSLRTGLYFTALDEFWELGGVLESPGSDNKSDNNSDNRSDQPTPNTIKLSLSAIKASSD